MGILSTLAPTVGRRWLYVTAAGLWGGAGLMLCIRAYGWLVVEDATRAIPLALAGIIAGVVINRVKFARIANKNIKRIGHLSEHENILAFQPPGTYVLILVMMGLGIALRHSSIPKPFLAVLYLGIGLGLILSSLSYFPYAMQPDTVTAS